VVDQLVQITRREGRIERVPRGETPTIETRLAAGQYITSVALRSHEYDAGVGPERKTVDWTWTAYVVTPLGAKV
jgi:hypothetical protein